MSDTNTTAFGTWLRQRRRELDLTQQQLADRVGYSSEMIRKVEAGMLPPSRQLIELLAEHLSVPDEERSALLDFARDPTPDNPGDERKGVAEGESHEHREGD